MSFVCLNHGRALKTFDQRGIRIFPEAQEVLQQNGTKHFLAQLFMPFLVLVSIVATVNTFKELKN